MLSLGGPTLKKKRKRKKKSSKSLYFDQGLECAATKRWSKYTTPRTINMPFQKISLIFNVTKQLILNQTKSAIWFQCFWKGINNALGFITLSSTIIRPDKYFQIYFHQVGLHIGQY